MVTKKKDLVQIEHTPVIENIIPKRAVEPPRDHEIFYSPDEYQIPISMNDRYGVYMNKTPYHLVEKEGWFPYYFDTHIDDQDVLSWLRSHSLPVNVWRISKRIVYPLIRFSPKQNQWNLDGFSVYRPERAEQDKSTLLNTVKCKIRSLLNPHDKNSYYLSVTPNLACANEPRIITVLHSPSMIRRELEPHYIRGLINIAKTTYPEIHRTGRYLTTRFDRLHLINTFFEDHAQLPHIVTLGVNNEEPKVTSWGADDIYSLMSQAKQIIDRGYVHSPENPLKKMANGNPFIAIRYQDTLFFLGQDGQPSPEDAQIIERIHVALSQGRMSKIFHLRDEVIWNRIRYQKPIDQVTVPEKFTFQWVEVKSSLHSIGHYWLLQAHHNGEVTDMAAFYHYPKSAQTTERLISFLMGPAYSFKNEHVLECSKKYYVKDEQLGIHAKEIESFKLSTEYLVRNCLDDLKEAQEALLKNEALKY